MIEQTSKCDELQQQNAKLQEETIALQQDKEKKAVTLAGESSVLDRRSEPASSNEHAVVLSEDDRAPVRTSPDILSNLVNRMEETNKRTQRIEQQQRNDHDDE